MDLLTLRGVEKWRRTAESAFVLAVPDLTLARGGAYAAMGPSGCGKSTLADLLALALRPDAGAAFTFAPREQAIDLIAAWRAGDEALGPLRRAHVGYVLQTGGLLPFLTVRANIRLPLALNGLRDRGRSKELAERLGITRQLDKLPADLSVGQRQRAAIARALVHRPALVIADEPTAALDGDTANAVFALLREETRTAGATLLVATHDRARAEGLTAIEFTATHRDGHPGSVAALRAS